MNSGTSVVLTGIFIDRIIRKQRQKDMSLYKEYMNEEFKNNFRSLVTKLIETPALVTINAT